MTKNLKAILKKKEMGTGKGFDPSESWMQGKTVNLRLKKKKKTKN